MSRRCMRSGISLLSKPCWFRLVRVRFINAIKDEANIGFFSALLILIKAWVSITIGPLLLRPVRLPTLILQPHVDILLSPYGQTRTH